MKKLVSKLSRVYNRFYVPIIIVLGVLIAITGEPVTGLAYGVGMIVFK